MKTKKKLLSSVVAVAAAAALLFGGTFAWQSVSQTALNEVSATMNPGGRLHDDFVEITYNEDGTNAYKTMTYNKDVYVENFTSLASNGVQVFARVRLDEYMELGSGAGLLNEDGSVKSERNKAVSLVAGATLEDKSTWTSHIYGAENDNDPFHEYWTWDFSGKTVYMPTFNKNKDSLEADINGTFANGFDDYTAYAEGYTLTANAIYDADTAEEGKKEEDELAKQGIDVADVIDGSRELGEAWERYIKVVEEPHTAKETQYGSVMTMAEYLDKLAANTPDFDGTGNYWVYDTDGWAYWASPIDPDTATGLLLDGIQRTETLINEDWYYAINVVAQFVTADDLGQDTATGFYDLTEGKAPTAEALLLLNTIGVDVNFEVYTEEELAEALAHGGTVTLMNDVKVTEQLTITEDTVLNLNGKTIEPAEDNTIWSEDDNTWSLISVQGENVTLVINGEGGVKAAENDSFCVDVRDGAKAVIYGGNYVGNISAVYVHTGEAVIYGGTYSIQQLSGNGETGYEELLNCYDENYKNGTAKITVCGGTFYDSSPEAANDGDLVPDGYTVESNFDDINNNQAPVTYTVKKITLNITEP